MMNHATFKASLFMAAGIIDHETGTRDMRRLSGLFRFMPITATLAMVASAAMAGVPLLNGFLSKEMFFAEAVETHADLPGRQRRALCRDARRRLHRRLFAALHPLACSSARRPADLPREPHEPPHWMRFPIELLVLACLVVGIVPGTDDRPFLHVAASSVLGAGRRSTAWRSGMASTPLLMSVVALVGGVIALPAPCRQLSASAARTALPSAPAEGPAHLRARPGRRCRWRWARCVETHLGTRRLQPQTASAGRGGVRRGALAAPVDGLRAAARLPVPAFDPAFALLWVVGIVCAVGAA